MMAKCKDINCGIPPCTMEPKPIPRTEIEYYLSPYTGQIFKQVTLVTKYGREIVKDEPV